MSGPGNDGDDKMADGGGTGADNWGRWGSQDERGTLNLLAPDVVMAAAGCVRQGRVLSLSLPIRGSTSNPAPLTVRICVAGRCLSTSCRWTEATTCGRGRDRPGLKMADDALVLSWHGTTTQWTRCATCGPVTRSTTATGRCGSAATARGGAASRRRGRWRAVACCSTSLATGAWHTSPRGRRSTPPRSRAALPRRAPRSAPATSWWCGPAGRRCGCGTARTPTGPGSPAFPQPAAPGSPNATWPWSHPTTPRQQPRPAAGDRGHRR